MKNVLITGGAGFIGSNLALTIEKDFPDAQISVLDDFRGGCFKNLLGFKGDVLAYDVADPSWMKILSKKPVDTIFHLASITDTTILDEKKMMFDNVEGFRNILNFAVEKKSTVVYASSAATYGSQDTPMKESDAGAPNNVYGFSKWVLENLARTYHDELKVVGVRYFNVFGPGEYYKGHASSMIYQLANQILDGKKPRIFTDGEQKRDHIYVKDVVLGTLMAREAKENTVINIGTGAATSFNKLIDFINEALGTSVETEYFGNPYNFYQNFTQADVSHTYDMTGFKCQFTVREAVIDYVQNYVAPRHKEQASKR